MRFSPFNRIFNKKKDSFFKDVVFVSSLVDVPENPGKSIYIVSSGQSNKWVVFRCPNNCGKRIEVNLMKSRYPYWKMKQKNKKITLYPSVVEQECGAHFWLENNDVIWSYRDDDWYSL